MANPDGPLTLDGLAQILRDHMNQAAAQFGEERAERRAQDAELRANIHDLRGEIGIVAAQVRDLAQVTLRQVDELEEHRRELRQIYARMEQHDGRMAEMTARMAEHDARFEAMARDIRRILDALERRGGDGGRQEA